MKKLYNDCIDEFLSDCSDFKLKSLHLSEIFRRSDYPDIFKRGVLIDQCGSFLRFGVDAETDDITLDGANFCRQRLCPMCQWRRSRRLYSQLSQVWEHLRSAGYEFLHMVLTVRNCSGDDLNGTINKMYRSFTRMLKDSAFVAIKGAIRFLEVTYNAKTATYHPHLHVLCVVRKSYFTSRYYIKQERLVSSWASYLGVDYLPSCHLEKANAGSIAEVAKYCVKPFDFSGLDWRDELAVYTTLAYALHGRRMIQTYGTIRQTMKECGIDDLEADPPTPPTPPAYMDVLYNAHAHQYEFI